MAAIVVDQSVGSVRESGVADMPLDGKENIEHNVDRQTPLKDTTNQKVGLSVTKSSKKNVEEMRKKLEEWKAKKGRQQPKSQSSVLNSQSVNQPSARKSILATRQSLLPPRLQSTTPAKTLSHPSGRDPAKSEAKAGKVSTKPLKEKAGDGLAGNKETKPVGKVKPRPLPKSSTAGPVFSRASTAQARPAPKAPAPVAERAFVTGIRASSSQPSTSTVQRSVARKSIAVVPSGSLKTETLSKPAPAARRSLASSLASARAVTMPNPSTKPSAPKTTASRTSVTAAPAERRSTMRTGISQRGPTLPKKASQPPGGSRPSVAKAAGDGKHAEKTRHQGRTGADKKAPKKDDSSPSSSSDSSRRLSFTISSGPNPELEVKLSGKKDAAKRQEAADTRRSAPAKPQGILRRSVPATTPGIKGGHSVKTPVQVRFTSPWNADEHPKSHPSFRKTPVRTQQSMRAELNAWLVAQGKTPSKFRHLLCFGAEMSAQKKAPPPSSNPSLTVGQMSQQQQVIEEEGRIVDHPLHSAQASSCAVDHLGPASTEQVAAEMAGSLDLSDREQEGQRSLEDRCTEAGQEEVTLAPIEGLTVLDVQRKLEAMMEEFHTLLLAGCPPHLILGWLGEIRQNVELARQSATFHRCCVQAHLAAGDLNGVLRALEEGIRCAAQPSEQLADTFREVMQQLDVTLYMSEVKPSLEAAFSEATLPSKLNFDLTSSPNFSASTVDEEEDREEKEEDKENYDGGDGDDEEVEPAESTLQSSAIKYMVTRVTPFSKSSARKSKAETQPEEEDSSLLVVTPVRRSMRRSMTATPQSACSELNPQSLARSGNRQRVLDCLEELASPELRTAIYTPNPALSRYSQSDAAQ